MGIINRWAHRGHWKWAAMVGKRNSRKDKCPRRGKLGLWIQKTGIQILTPPFVAMWSHVSIDFFTLSWRSPFHTKMKTAGTLWGHSTLYLAHNINCSYYHYSCAIETTEREFHEKIKNAKGLGGVREDRDWKETTTPLEIFQGILKAEARQQGVEQSAMRIWKLALALPSRTLAERKKEGYGSIGRVGTIRVVSDAKTWRGLKHI